VNELIEYAQSIISYLEQNGANLNLESQQALGELLQNLLQVIQEQSQNEEPTSGTPPLNANQPLTPAMPSSNVEGFAYDDKTGNLMVRFLGDHPNRNGPVYSYSGVPKEIFDMFQQGAVPARTDGQNKWGRWWKGKVPSIGASLYTLIKNRGYPYQRVSG
jgi:hypothetical protein